jgi:hypothetical protein
VQNAKRCALKDGKASLKKYSWGAQQVRTLPCCGQGVHDEFEIDQAVLKTVLKAEK